MHGNTLFDRSKEKHTLVGRFAAVEPERKFVKIGLEMIFFKGALIRAHQPSLNKRGHAMHAGKVSLFAGAFNGLFMVGIFVFGGPWIGVQSVCVSGESGSTCF